MTSTDVTRQIAEGDPGYLPSGHRQIDRVGSTGQVHHHLRELRAAGLVGPQKRNHYAIRPDLEMKFPVIVAAALGRRVAGQAG
jgi:hypothetical protein